MKITAIIKKGLRFEPALIVGGILTGPSAAVTLISGDGLADGLQLDEAAAIVAPILASIGIRFKVDSPATVERAPRR